VPADVLIAPFNDLETTTKLVESFASELACVIVEPLQRYLPPVAGFLEGLRQLTTRHDILLVFDEVVTGFRLAYGGAQEYYGVTPDLVAYGKALGGGFPIGAVAGPAEILDLCSRMQRKEVRVFQSGTLSGNPVSSVAALATLHELRKPGSYARLRSLGEHARAGLRGVFQRRRVAAQVLGDGPLLNVVFTDTPVTDYRSSLSGDRKKSLRFHIALTRQGLLVNPYGRMYFSTVHTDDDLETLFEAAHNAAASL
jgi:glutamate-1-semialdehyde 2,1-aminomutase